jgi:UDP-N-acetylglucosamine--N-acetylmuramyl-(pentapeptide) pyrophosphoryl-undecaprenol N-acetylglucosamine transferase
MDLAYHIADVIISRAGAATISELCILGKPCVLVPSPNVAEDHQTKNALALVSRKAALMVKDSEATALLVKEALELLKNETLKAELGKNCLKLALPGAASNIVHEIFKIAGNRERNR